MTRKLSLTAKRNEDDCATHLRSQRRYTRAESGWSGDLGGDGLSAEISRLEWIIHRGDEQYGISLLRLVDSKIADWPRRRQELVNSIAELEHRQKKRQAKQLPPAAEADASCLSPTASV